MTVAECSGSAGRGQKIDQHMVSRALIKNWCVPSSKRVEYFDLRNGPRHRTAAHPSQIMYRRSDDEGQGFVPVEYARELEQDWNTVEFEADKQIQAVLSDVPIDNTHREAVLDLMALHLLRSSETLGRLIGIQGEAANDVLDDVTSDDEFKRIMLEEDMSREEAETTVDRAIRAPDGFIQNTRRSFAENLPRWLELYRERMAMCGLILRRCETSSLMLGDGPAFLSIGTCLECATSTMFGMLDEITRCSMHSDVSAFWSGWHCWMPLSPDVIAQASPRVQNSDEMLPCFESQIYALNKMQCQRAQLRVVVPPGSQHMSESFVRQYAEFAPPKHPYKMAGVPPSSEQWNH